MILVGLPGAGKTTFYEVRFKASHRHISKDLWPHARGREGRQRRLLQDALASGASVVLDNVNASRAERAPLIQIAAAYGARVTAYYFDVSTREAVARNTERAGRGKVPNVAIFTARKRLEPPTAGEGFDEVYTVRPNRDRTFAVEPVAKAIRRPLGVQ